MKKINKSFLAGIITFGLTLVGFIATIFLFFYDHKDIPLGILLGGTFFGSMSLIGGFMENKDEKGHTSINTIILIIAKFILNVSLILGVALLYYQADIKIFNLFAVVGAYTVNAIATVVTYLINKD